MEIISYVLEGELAHKDSMGNGSVIRPGDVQRMSAGTGITHSEFNPLTKSKANFLQIWLLPTAKRIRPGYEQRHFAPDDRQGRFKLLVSPDGRGESISANSDALIYGALLDEGQSVGHGINPDRTAYVHVARGTVEIDAHELKAGDGATLGTGSNIQIAGRDKSEVLLFDLPLNHH